jgi:hypothetical protein
MVREKEGKLIVDLAGYRRHRGWLLIQHHWREYLDVLNISTYTETSTYAKTETHESEKA